GGGVGSPRPGTVSGLRWRVVGSRRRAFLRDDSFHRIRFGGVSAFRGRFFLRAYGGGWLMAVLGGLRRRKRACFGAGVRRNRTEPPPTHKPHDIPTPERGTALPQIPGYEVEAVLGRGGQGVLVRGPPRGPSR